MTAIGMDIEGSPSAYRMKVTHEVLIQGHILGIQPDDMVDFFATQVSNMLVCPPNYNKFGEKARIWVMRGFYPSTQIFFKMVIIGDGGFADSHYVKVSVPTITSNRRSPAFSYFDGATLNERTTLRMENAFLNADHVIPPLMTRPLRMPRCMSPKGCKVFTYKKPRRIRNEKSPRRKNVRKIR